MKALYIPGVVLAVILGLCLWISAESGQLTNAQLEMLDGAQREAEAENWAQLAHLLKQAESLWQSRGIFLHTTNRHDELDEIRSLLTAAQAACAARDGDGCAVYLAQLRLHLELLADNHRFTLGNIL